MRLFGSNDVAHSVRRHLERRDDLAGRTVIDFPAGSGRMTEILLKLGAKAEAYDLFPDRFKIPGMVCGEADLTQKTSIPSGHADLVLCQEGIEHIPNQFATLKELSRILKPKGRLIITTPNISNLRGKLSNFLVESEYYRRMPGNEVQNVFPIPEGRENPVFGHVFLIGAQRLRTLARVAGMKLVKTHPVKISRLSMIMGVLYPFLFLVNYFLYFDVLRKIPPEDMARAKETFKEIIKLNLNPHVLFGKSLIFEFEKIGEPPPGNE